MSMSISKMFSRGQTLLPALSRLSLTRCNLQSVLGSYVELTKPRIVALLDFTALAAFLVATPQIDWVRLVLVIVAGTLASGGAGALNCYLDRNLDSSMRRTSERPIPRGEITPTRALIFGLAMVSLGVLISVFLLPVDRKSTR